MKFFKSLFGRKASPEVHSFDASLAPEEAFFVIGDLHGCLTEFEDLIEVIEAKSETPKLVCVGDYVDRGEDVAPLLKRLFQLNSDFPRHFICLKGNHEDMLLKFLSDPEQYGPRWLRHGGLQTLASYGVGRQTGDTQSQLAQQLSYAMGAELIDWIKRLPLSWTSGNVTVTHAGADPSVPIDAQAAKTLLWGHPDFLKLDRQDGQWVVYGHVIQEHGLATQGTIAVDTGAYATGVLTAAHIENDAVSFLTNRTGR